MRFRVHYSKREDMRYTGHLDLYRAWERLIRRARLPLAYSQGYNPRPKINLSPALPLGFTSECELIDVWLEKPLPKDEINARLQEAAPPGIKIQAVEVIEDSEPAVQNTITSVEYEVRIDEPPADLSAEIERVMTADELQRTRRNKPYDLRPLIEALEMAAHDDSGSVVRMRLACRDGATGRPDEVLKELGYPPHQADIHRKKFLFPVKE